MSDIFFPKKIKKIGFFGQLLKEMRLEYAKMGLRKFSEEIGMNPSELSKIEHGYVKPPSEKKWIDMIGDKLGLISSAPERDSLYFFWCQQFVMQEMPENFFPVFVSTLDDNPLTETKFKELTDWLNNIAKEHNKKAEEYNKKNNRKNNEI